MQTVIEATAIAYATPIRVEHLGRTWSSRVLSISELRFDSLQMVGVGDRMPFMKPICPQCSSKEVRFRAKDKTFGCRVCGHRWKKSK